MNFSKWTGLCVTVFMATSFCSAQQRFPLRPGEWVATMSVVNAQDTTTELPYCLNDETWQKAFNQMPSCTIQNFNVTSTSASYTLDCDMKIYRMSGNVVMTFDGMEHMTGKGAIDMTMNGNTTHSISITDFRWKSPTCSPNDMNLRVRK